MHEAPRRVPLKGRVESLLFFERALHQKEQEVKKVKEEMSRHTNWRRIVKLGPACLHSCPGGFNLDSFGTGLGCRHFLEAFSFLLFFSIFILHVLLAVG